jgi:PKD repeat protein
MKMKNKYILILLLITVSVSSVYAQLMPVSVTGFNKDVIADGTAGALASTNVTNGFDQAGWAFVAQNFNGLTTCALPMSRTINSNITSGLTYVLNDYTQNNALYLTANNSPASLSFNVFRSASVVYVLGTTGSGSSVANITVNFNDGTNQVFTNNNFPDWFNTPGAANSIGRVNVNNNNLECGAGGPNLAQITLPISVANSLKPITSIDVNRTSASGATSSLGILAVSINFSGVIGGGNPFLAPPISSFAYDAGIDTVWVNSPYAFINNSTGDSASYWRVEGQPGATQCVPNFGCYHQISNSVRNFRYRFTDTGSYLVTLVVHNRIGRDSTSKWVYVGYPSKKPVANFFMDKQVIGVSEQIPVYDLSENGPTSWRWTVSPECRGCETDPNLLPNDFLPNTGTQLPVLRARNAGKFDICLKVWNNVGEDSVCKKDYIEVIGGLSMCASAADTIGTQPSGYVYDNGGPNQPYFPSIMGNCYYTIDPCASSVTAYLERFRLRNQDTIIFRNGGPTGPILRKLGGGNLPDSVRTLVATSGRLYMQWQLGAPQNASIGDSGIVIRWTSIPATYSAPNAFFTSVDTAYSGQKVNYINGTTGQGLLSYTWDVNGDGTYNDHMSGNGANFTFTTVAPLLRDICVRVSNCKGSSTYCKQIIVLPVQTRPIANFSSPRPAGFTTDTFRLVDISRNGPNQWRWEVTPKNILYVSGTDSSSQNPIFMLTAPGKYAVRLVARNNFGVDSIERFFYIDVLAYNQPNTDFPIANASDVGITRVVFDNVDTTTALKTPTYTALFNVKRGVLYRGVPYTLEVMRPTGISPMERKAWIDFNFDADFIDPGELILNESNGTNLVGRSTFTIPNDIAPGRVTRLRVGVSEGGTTLTPDKARSGCFEDYAIEIGLDIVPPTISLKGSSVHRVQRGTIYFDPGVLAIDNREGDISTRYETSNNINMNTVGIYTARYWVKDLYGNVSDTIERTVQVEVNQLGPTVTLKGADTVYVEARRDSYIEQGAVAVNNVGDSISDRIVRIGMVDTAFIGTYYVNYSVRDEFGFTGEKTRVVIVRKTTIPELIIPGIVKHQINTPYLTGSGIGRRDGYFTVDQLTLTQVGSPNVTVPGSYFIQVTLCDPLNNCTPSTQVQIDVQDTIAPVVSLLGANPLIVDVYNQSYEDPGVSASDNYYSESSLIRLVNNQVNVNKLGTYQISYTIKDGSNNSTTVSREVRVVDRIAPVIEILGSNPFDMARFQDYIEPGFRIIDNYNSDEELRPSVVITSNLGKRNDTLWADLSGWRYVRYSVTDQSGNKSNTVERTIRVIVTSLDEIETTGTLSIYPNPSTGRFNISTKEALTGKTEVVMYNVLGAKVHSEQVDMIGNKAEINVTGLPTGIYLLQLTNNGKQYTQRVTVK